MKTYYQTEHGIDTGELFVPTDHPYYTAILEEVKANLATIVQSPVVKFDETWHAIRTKRNLLLQESDWTALTDTVISKKTEWAAYREALRQIPQTTVNSNKVVWPTSPTN